MKKPLYACILGYRNKCPSPVSSKEPPLAEELRSIMSGNVYLSDNGVGLTFINQLTSNPLDPCICCETLLGNYFCLVSLEHLKKNTDWLKVNDHYLYPMLVWAKSKNKPVLVALSPGHKKPVKVIRKHSSDCLAFIICMTKQTLTDQTA